MTDDFYIKPDRKHSALVVIDVQQDFTLIGATAEIPGTSQAVQYMRSLLLEYRKKGYPIIHVIRLYNADGSNVDLCRRKSIEDGNQVVISGTDGAELIDELKPSPDIRLNSSLLLSGNLQQIGPMEWILYKPRWSAFNFRKGSKIQIGMMMVMFTHKDIIEEIAVDEDERVGRQPRSKLKFD